MEEVKESSVSKQRQSKLSLTNKFDSIRRQKLRAVFFNVLLSHLDELRDVVNSHSPASLTHLQELSQGLSGSNCCTNIIYIFCNARTKSKPYLTQQSSLYISIFLISNILI